MGYELLDAVTTLLREEGLRAGEEYPAGEQMEILSPAAAVGLGELDPVQGTAMFTVRVLSPRMLGGWCCQVWAARAVQALTGGGMTCSTGKMEYLKAGDCFCVVLTALWPVVRQGESWIPGSSLQVSIGEQVQQGVESFRAVQSRGRRLVGAFSQDAPVGVTLGSGGWSLELIQRPGPDPEEEQEPFVLTVRNGDRMIRYTGCCWNETVWNHDQRGAQLTRRGFALGREVEAGE